MKKFAHLKSFADNKTKIVRPKNFLGAGIEGVVYALPDNKVIKLFYPLHEWEDYSKVLHSISKRPNKFLSKIYDYGTVSKTNIAVDSDNFGDDLDMCYYIGEKLYDLNEDEQALVYCTCFGPDYTYLYRDIKSMTKLKKKYDNLYKLLTRINSPKYQRRFIINDIHEGNIMKDKNKNYKIVDLGDVRKR